MPIPAEAALWAELTHPPQHTPLPVAGGLPEGVEHNDPPATTPTDAAAAAVIPRRLPVHTAPHARRQRTADAGGLRPRVLTCHRTWLHCYHPFPSIVADTPDAYACRTARRSQA